MTFLRHELTLLLAAVMFLTRLPVPAQADPPDDQLARAARHFPVVGLIVGLIAGLVWLIALPFFGASVAAGLAIASGVLTTGALHEDGLADTCDGLGGGATRERALEIMRDSRIGAYGAIGLILSIGLRWAALAMLSPWTGFAALVAAHAISRTMVVATIATAAYARDDGTAREVADGVEGGEVAITLILCTFIACVSAGWAGIYALVAAVVAGGFVIALLIRKLRGYTGDGLGAVEQVAEIAAIITLAGALS